MNKQIEKIHHLNEYLKKKYHVELSTLLHLSIEEMDEILKEKRQPDEEMLKSISEIFYLDVDILKDDTKNLPHDEYLKVDELKVRLHQGDYVNDIEKNRNKNVIKKNYALLDKKMRKRFFIHLACCILPFLFVVCYALVTSIVNSMETLSTYREGDTLSESQKKIEDEMLSQDTKTNPHYVNVKVGVSLEGINNISTSNSNYNATLTTTFDFDQVEYFRMYYRMTKGAEFDSFYTDEDFLADNFCFNSEGNGYLEYKDNIPDVLQFNFEEGKHMSKDLKPESVSTIYLEQLNAYPGEKSSNVYTSKNDEFRIGNGRIAADSLEYQDKGTAYYDSTTKSYRYSQRLHFQATISKTFDSPRYPLDSAQFKIYIQPTRSSDYVRYVADKEVSGFSTYFSMSNGYRLINERDNIKNFNVKLNYYKDKDIDHSSSTYNQDIIKTQLEVTIRANKHGIATYLNSFLNIIAVAIWLILAFYNQSFNRDDSMSMIGTGFFSAISAILLGLSSVSIANTFSLLTIINIFTLMMVLVMGFEIIKYRRYVKLSDATMVAYSTAKMRILFYFLAICSIVVYLLIPAISYLWIL